MSGVVGIIYFDHQAVKPETVQSMLNAIAHRGADGVGIWTSAQVGLGHCLLLTLPEDAGQDFPLVLNEGQLAITADVRLDNRDELIRLLHLNRREAESRSDSFFLLKAYQEWGEHCAERLLGDFAFAIWDNTNQTLFCARDHMGMKPFYYYRSNEVFLFASEIKALFAFPEVPHEINEQKVATYLENFFDDDTETFYTAIFRLPPAHSLNVSLQNAKPLRYWQLDRSRRIQLATDEEYAEQFRLIFTEAVRCRLRSTAPIGSMLSGGIDSSSVTCVARDLLKAEGKTPLSVFSATTPEVPESDESEYINAILASGDLEPHSFRIDSTSSLHDFGQIGRYLDEPYSAPNGLVNWEADRMAHDLGIRVMLDGFDGDTTVSHGFAYLSELIASGKWDKFTEETRDLHDVTLGVKASENTYLNGYISPTLRLLALRNKWMTVFRRTYEAHQYYGYPLRRIVVGSLIHPLAPKGILKLWRRLRKQKNLPEPLSLVRPDLAERVNLRRLKAQAQKHSPDFSFTEREHHWRRLNAPLLADILELINTFSAAWQLETRSPYMDKRLIEFCFALPPTQKIRMGWTRLVVRNALQGVLPLLVQWRPGKSNMSNNFRKIFLTYDSGMLDNIIKNEPAELQAYVAFNQFASIYQTYRENTLASPMPLWRTLSLLLWLTSETK